MEGILWQHCPHSKSPGEAEALEQLVPFVGPELLQLVPGIWGRSGLVTC
jgi:hypothetical protein